jgi:serine/threonine protein kinase
MKSPWSPEAVDECSIPTDIGERARLVLTCTESTVIAHLQAFLGSTDIKQHEQRVTPILFGTSIMVTTQHIFKTAIAKPGQRSCKSSTCRDNVCGLHREIAVFTELRKWPATFEYVVMPLFMRSTPLGCFIVAPKLTIDLFDYRANFEGPPTRAIMTDLVTKTLAGLRHLHKLNIAHADIKPQNIVVTPSPDGTRLLDVKFIDFDMSSMFGGVAGTQISEFDQLRWSDAMNRGTLQYSDPVTQLILRFPEEAGSVRHLRSGTNIAQMLTRRDYWSLVTTFSHIYLNQMMPTDTQGAPMTCRCGEQGLSVKTGMIEIMVRIKYMRASWSKLTNDFPDYELNRDVRDLVFGFMGTFNCSVTCSTSLDMADSR